MLHSSHWYWLSTGHINPLFLNVGSSPDTPGVGSAKKSDIRVLNSLAPSFDLHIPFHIEEGTFGYCIHSCCYSNCTELSTETRHFWSYFFNPLKGYLISQESSLHRKKNVGPSWYGHFVRTHTSSNKESFKRAWSIHLTKINDRTHNIPFNYIFENSI